MRFYKKIYMSPSLTKKRKKILWKLRSGRPQPTIYIITLATNNDLFEIHVETNVYLAFHQPFLNNYSSFGSKLYVLMNINAKKVPTLTSQHLHDKI